MMSLILNTKVGSVRVESSEKGISHISFTQEKKSRSLPHPFLKKASIWLESFFEGDPSPFPWDLLDLSQATDFERRVWKTLWKIPFGETRSYKDIARSINCPRGFRAVGNANGRNPVPIIIPCHRVIAHDGSLGGYSCGLNFKKKLLTHEGVDFREH